MKKIIVLLLVLCTFFTACSNKDSETIKIATDATWPPMEFVNTEMQIVGYDIDMMTEAAKVGNFEVEFINTSWEGIFAGLAVEEYDAVISSVTITEERQATMDFSIPYINAGQILIVPKTLEGITTLDQMNGMEVGAQQGTTGAFEVSANENASLRLYDEIGLAVADLANGKIAGVVCDTPVAADFILQNESYNETLQIVGEPFTDEFYGVAVKKGNSDILDKINAALTIVLEDEEFMDALEDKWLR